VALTDRERLRLLELEEEELQLQAAQKATLKSEEKPGISTLESGLRGAAQGATLGFSDEITGGAEAAYSKLTGDERRLSDIYSKSRDESRLANKLSEEENPGTYTASNLGAGLATMLIPGLNIAKGASLGRAALQGSKIGAAAGLGASDEEIASMGALKDMSMGAGFGGAFGAGGQKLGNMISKVDTGKMQGDLVDNMKRIAEIQSAKAQGLERGTRNALNKGVPVSQIDQKVRAIGRQGLDEDVLGGGKGSSLFKKLFGNNAEEMIERNQQVKDSAMSGRKTAYDIIDAEGASEFNPQDVISKIKSELGGFNQESPLNSSRLNQFNDTIEAINQRGNKNLSMDDAQSLVSELGNSAKFDANRMNQANEFSKDAYGITRQAINEAAEKAGDKIGMNDLGDLVRESNRKYSISKDADKVMTNKLARGANKSISITDTIVGVANPYLLPAKSAWERGGNRAAAIGLDKLGDLVKNNAQAFGKFQNVLQGASQKGGNALGATHYMLYQQNPEYREMLKKQQDGEE